MAAFLAFAVLATTPLGDMVGVNLTASADTTITKTGQEIAEYFSKKEGQEFSNSACLTFVRSTFEEMGASQSTACCAYYYGINHLQSTSYDNIPLGANVYWYSPDDYSKTCDYGHRPGHVGVHIGNNRVIGIELSIKKSKLHQ